MKQTNLKIKNLFGNGEKLTFLIGAGCSVDAPSNVPDGNAIKKELISYFCAESEIENILKIEDLKLEQILEIIYSSLDEDPKIADYFGLFNKPNLQHFFLADYINKGHFVMTTNFDFLIESALIKLNIPINEILPVITDQDFENYSNPTELFKRRFKTIYKIHGSAKNVITGEDIMSSFIKTIKTLGLNKAGKSIFQIEPLKRILLDNICRGRSLIIMGYSSINDFDIIPTIKAIKHLKELIWINHSESIQPGNEIIYEILSGKSKSLPKTNKVLIAIAEKLHEICHIGNTNKIYLINANTANIVKELIQIKVNLSSEIPSLSIKDWLKKNIKTPSVFEKIWIVSRIYYEIGLFSDAMRCSEIMIRLTTLTDVESWKLMAQEAIYKSFMYQRKNPEKLNQRTRGDKTKSQREILIMRSKCLNLMANIYHSKENYSDAMKKFEETLAIHEKLGDLKDIATSLNNIANIYYTNNKYNEALKNYNKALKIYNQLGDLNNKTNSYINIGECLFAQDDYPKAIKSYLSALKISREQGSLKGKVESLNRLGDIMRIQKNYSKALKFTMNAIKFNDQLRDLTGKAISFKLIASIKNDQGYYQEAITFYNRALKIYEKLGNLTEIANSMTILANLFKLQEKYSKALKQNKRALKIYDKIGDLNGKTNCLFNIATLNFDMVKHEEALKYYEELLALNKKTRNLSINSISLKNIGIIHQIQGNFSEALKGFQEALKIYEKLDNIRDQAIILYKIAMVNFDQRDYPNALIYFNKALTIYRDLEDLKGIALCLDNIGNLFRTQGDYLEALNLYNMSLEIYDGLGDLSMKAECFINMGEIYKIQGKFSIALKRYKEALNLSKKLGDLKREAICLNYIGNILRLQGNYPEALELCMSVLKISQEGNNLSVRANCLKNIALINHDQGNYPEALKYYRESLLIYKNYELSEKSEINDIKKKIEAIFRLFQKKNTLKEKETVQPDLPEVKLEINKKKDIKLQLDSSDLRKEYNDYKDFEINLKYYEKMLENAEISGDLYKRLNAINQIGEIYRIRGWYLEAVKIYEEGLEIAEKLEDKSIKFIFVSKIRALYNDFFNIF
ncbi:MAG: tetratricopeptide repeat protein [Promethearchaeota archaeon]